jgi:hypothetical protein
MGRRFDLLTVRRDLLEAPVTLPTISTPYISRMRGCGRGYADAVDPMIARAAAPLPFVDFESTPARHLVSILHTQFRDLPETIVAGPALLAGGEVRIRWDVAMGLLPVGATQPPHRADERHTRRGYSSFEHVDADTSSSWPSGGEGGIRTHGPLAGTPVFKTGAINRSATSPAYISITWKQILESILQQAWANCTGDGYCRATQSRKSAR